MNRNIVVACALACALTGCTVTQTACSTSADDDTTTSTTTDSLSDTTSDTAGTTVTPAALPCPNPLLSFDPDGEPATAPMFPDNVVIAGGIEPPDHDLECSTLIVGFSSEPPCVMPEVANVLVGRVTVDGSFLVSLSVDLPVANAYVVELGPDAHEIHFRLPEGFAQAALTDGQRPLVGVRIESGICPLVISPTCGGSVGDNSYLLVNNAMVEGWTSANTNMVFGVEGCVTVQ